MGSLLVAILPFVRDASDWYAALRTAATVLCPAWLLGPFEYSLGAGPTLLIIAIANMTLWALLGALLSLHMRLTVRIAMLLAALVPISYGTMWLSESIAGTIGLLLIISLLALYRPMVVRRT